jgi:2-aminoadipate transaminase
MKYSALSQQGRRTTPPPISWLMKTALAHPGLISLAAGFTDNATLPVRSARKLLNEILATPQSGQPALQYGTTAGEPALRQLTATRLQQLDGQQDKSHAADRVIITSGSQQLLYMTMEALCDEGDIVLVEDPTYFVFLGILQSRGVRACGVKLERDGLSLAHLEAVLERLKKSGELARVKALYLVSYFQNPTGATTSLAKKAAVLKLLRSYERAAGHPLYLLEDAAYRELRFAGQDIPSALTLRGAADRVIYAGTYSKSFATGARLGFGLLPEPLFSTVINIKGNHDFGSANLIQALLTRALASNQYGQHLNRIRKGYARKAAIMQRALAEHFPADAEIWSAEGGLYFWVRLPAKIRTGVKSKLFQTALKNNVLYVPGSLCYADDPARPKPDHEMRLSFGSASETALREGVARLGATLRQLSSRKS